MPHAFHEVLFPLAVAFGAAGGPERKTEIVILGSGHEERNSRWADSRRRYDAGSGVRSIEDLYAIAAFFEERRGRLYGFRYRDPVDHRSSTPGTSPVPFDQTIGTGDGTRATFQLTKTYGGVHAPWVRRIDKPVAESVRVAVAGSEVAVGAGFTVDAATGVVTFQPGHVPAGGATVTAGFEFDVPVRFDTDRLEISLTAFSAGSLPSVPIVEIRL
ncbi:TIGR02217 family protein [Amorphus sp. 3PC139-8]|uniref:phage distal tail protein, Rcc01695 family n=1 Tax=Amorphus sp. 3PC139-8 TaxID=2735676 RepID=UPI00345DA244